MSDSFEEACRRADAEQGTQRKLAELAALSRLEYGRRRKDEARKLGVPLAILDREVADFCARQKPAHNFLPHWEVQPWSEEVNGVALLDNLRWQFARYVVLPAHADVALALWVMHTWVFERFDITPYLSITSPTRRCGKTVLMTLLYFLSCRGKKSDSMSKAAIYRSVDGEKPTLVLDEVGWVIDPKDERQGILCGGFERNGYVEVCEGEGAAITTRLFSTYCPKAFGLIGKLTATLTDRSICIPMRRKLRTERVERLRRQDNEQFAQLRQRCLRWANDNAETLAQAPRLELDELNDRALDFWEPLLTIADRAGGEWPQLARTAALALSGEGDGEDLRVDLLKDIGTALADDDVIRSVDLIERLASDPERPWAEYNRGKPINQKQLAGLLKPFGIISVNVNPPGRPQGKGYRRSDFEEAWAVYCPGQNFSSADSELFIRPSVHRPMESAQVSDFASVHEASADGSKNTNLSYSHAGLDGRTGKNHESGGERDFATTSPSPNTIGGRPSRVPYDPGPIPECLLRVPRDGNGQPARVPSDYDAALEELAIRGKGTPEACAQCGAAAPGPLLHVQAAEGVVRLHRECVRFWLKANPQPRGRPVRIREIRTGTLQ